MQQPSYLDDIQQIVELVGIEADDKLSFRGEPYEGYDYPEASAEAGLFHNLSNLLYSACYTRSNAKQQNSISNDEVDSFLPTLSEANASTEHYDCNWIVEEIEQTGNILVRKGGYKRHTFAGDFIREHFGQGPLQRGESVNIRVLPEYGTELETAEAFYFVFGETLLESNNSTVVRLYFNLIPKGANALVALISNKLNRYNIPFQFKCLNRPTLYTRCDSAVLYFDKRYFDIVGDIMAENYSSLKKWLNVEVPMFTRILVPGIGFAENPFSASESFGTNRCKIIAQAIVNAWKDKQPKDNWLDYILKNIQKNYLLPEALYLNPNSKYPYHFPGFEN
jgi:type III HopA1-like effector protein